MVVVLNLYRNVNESWEEELPNASERQFFKKTVLDGYSLGETAVAPHLRAYVFSWREHNPRLDVQVVGPLP